MARAPLATRGALRLALAALLFARASAQCAANEYLSGANCVPCAAASTSAGGAAAACAPCSGAACSAADYIVTSLAGGTIGFADAAAGALAAFAALGEVALDGAGFVIVADTGNRRLRRVDPRDGRTATIAGDGVARTKDGPFGENSLAGPTSLAVNTQTGDIYVGDAVVGAAAAVNVRRLAPSGALSTLTPAPLAGAAGPPNALMDVRLAVDGSGRVLVAQGAAVRVLDAASGATTQLFAVTLAAGSALTGLAAAGSRIHVVHGATLGTYDLAGAPLFSTDASANCYDGGLARVVTDPAGAPLTWCTCGTGNLAPARFAAPPAAPLWTVRLNLDITGQFSKLSSCARGFAMDATGRVTFSDMGSQAPSVLRQASSGVLLVTSVAGMSGPPLHLDGAGTGAAFAIPGTLATVDTAVSVAVGDMTVSGVSQAVAVGRSLILLDAYHLNLPHALRTATGSGVVGTLAGSSYANELQFCVSSMAVDVNTVLHCVGNAAYYTAAGSNTASAAVAGARAAFAAGNANALAVSGRRGTISYLQSDRIVTYDPLNGAYANPITTTFADAWLANGAAPVEHFIVANADAGNRVFYIATGRVIYTVAGPTGAVAVFVGGGPTPNADGSGTAAAFSASTSAAAGFVFKPLRLVYDEAAQVLYVLDANGNALRAVGNDRIVRTLNPTRAFGWTDGAPNAATFRFTSEGGDFATNPPGIITLGDAIYLTDPGNNALRSLALTQCPRGFYCANRYTSLPCPGGRYGATPGQARETCDGACEEGYFCPPGSTSPRAQPCPPGAACPAGSAAPVPCAAGTAMPLAAAAKCLPCAPSTLAPAAGAQLCTEYCPAGTFRGAVGGVNATASCTLCEAGAYSSAPGSTSCTSCPAGSASSAAGAASAAACRPCAAGYFVAQPGAADCAACAAGSYSAAAGSTACVLCPPGRASSATGAASAAACRPCAAGSFSAQPGAADCAACAAGSYSAAEGSTACVLCPPGRASNATGAAAACAPCAVGFVAPAAGTTTCTACPAGTSSADGLTCVVFTCPAGQQPAVGVVAPASLADCTPLVCAPPLTLVGASCQGCPPGTSGSAGSCVACGGGLCPGGTSRPLFNFSSLALPAAGSHRALAAASPWAACPSLGSGSAGATAAANAGAVAATAAAARALSNKDAISIAAGAIGLALLITIAARGVRAFTSRHHEAVDRVFKAIDMYALKKPRVENEHPTYHQTFEGGVVSLVALASFALYAAYLVLDWQTNNIFTSSSLGLLAGSLATPGFDAAAWASTARLPGLPAGASALVLRLTVDGQSGVCSAPLAPPQAVGLERGAWALVASAADCGGTGVSQLTYACAGCLLTPSSALTLLFDRSCQSWVIEAAAVPAHPPDAVRVMRANTLATVASAEGNVAALRYTLSAAFNTWTGADGAARKGYDFATSSTSITRAAGGAAAIVPNAAAVSVTCVITRATLHPARPAAATLTRPKYRNPTARPTTLNQQDRDAARGHVLGDKGAAARFGFDAVFKHRRPHRPAVGLWLRSAHLRAHDDARGRARGAARKGRRARRRRGAQGRRRRRRPRGARGSGSGGAVSL